MPGTFQGGKQAATTNKSIYGEDFYAVIGAKGGRVSTTGGFTDRELARAAGRLGGMVSRRGKKLTAKERQFVRTRYMYLQRQSDAQVSSLSQKYGVKRSW